MVRHAPIHRRSDHSDIAICCGRNVRGSSLSTSVVPLSNQVTTLNHKRFKGFKMFSDGHLALEAIAAPVHDTQELESVVAAHAREPNGSLVVMPDGFLNVHRAEIVLLAARYHVPEVYPWRFFAETGGW